MLSFRLAFFGRETLIQMRTLSGCGMASIEFALKFGKGGESNGPATNPFFYP
jgi:hypothetical protein